MLCWKICKRGEGLDGTEPAVHMLAVARARVQANGSRVFRNSIQADIILAADGKELFLTNDTLYLPIAMSRKTLIAPLRLRVGESYVSESYFSLHNST